MKKTLVIGLLLCLMVFGVATPAQAVSCGPDEPYPGVGFGAYSDKEGAYLQVGNVVVRCHWQLP